MDWNTINLELKKSSPELLHEILLFNFCPSQYLHKERYPDTWKNIGIEYNDIMATTSGQYALSSYLIDNLNLTNKYCFDFKDPTRRLALISIDNLMKTAYTAGALLLGNQLEKLIKGDEIREIASIIGREPITKSLELLPKFKKINPENNWYQSNLPLTKSLLYAANEVIASWLAQEVDEVRKRVYLKFSYKESPTIVRYPKLSLQALNLVTHKG